MGVWFHVSRRRRVLPLLIALLLVEDGDSLVATSPAISGRPRLLVLTDIGGDPDDQQSLIRLMVYANELDVEGLVASASGTPGELKEAVTRPDLIREIVAAYGKVRDQLARHDPRYPRAADLLARVKSGNPRRGLPAIGEHHDTEASRWIVAAAERGDPRPLNVAVWGGQTDLAQALWRIRRQRGAEEAARVAARLSVYDIADQDGIQPWIVENFPGLFYVLAKHRPGEDRRTSAFRGMYLGGDETLTSREWVEQHVRANHGALGALYPPKTWTAPNPHGALKEGDTPSWLYFLPNGLSDPARPDWGGWGGRFERAGTGPWRDAEDAFAGARDARVTVSRWREAFQADFAARMDWCVKPPQGANHPPRPALNGTRDQRIVQIAAKPGRGLTLSAAGSTDPDGDPLSFRWFVYPEAGTYRGDVALAHPTAETVTVIVPPDAAGTTLHVILEATDHGRPPLTRYRRTVLHVGGNRLPR